MKLESIAAFACAATAAGVTHAATYYVDVSGGNDGLNGTTAATAWQNLSKLSSATLQPGDSVLLKRDGVWRETLALRSGVTYSDYGSGAKPLILGSVPVGGLGWQLRPGSTSIYEASVANLNLGLSNMSRLYLNGSALTRARHPNAGAGSYTAAMNSRYYKMTAASPISTTQFVMETGKVPGGADLVGAEAFIRSDSWLLAKYSVTARVGDTVTVALNSEYPTTWGYSLRTGYGFRLENKLWMLDQPGEWVYDATAQKIYLWMPDGSSPAGKNLSASVRKGATGAGINGFALVNVSIRETAGDAVVVRQATNFNFAALSISGSSGRGIAMFESSSGTVQYSQIEHTAKEAVSTAEILTASTIEGSSGINIQYNQISDAGNDEFAPGAIRGGVANMVSNNVLDNVGQVGIGIGRQSLVFRNVITNACAAFDDCAAIVTIGRSTPNSGFVTGSPLGVVIASNIVDNVPGSADGIEDLIRSGRGIYLDDFSNDVTVESNLVTRAGSGIYLHNAKSNKVLGNAFVGNLSSQISFFENSSDGAMLSNVVSKNVVASLNTGPLVASTAQSGSASTSDDFASYDENAYTYVSNRFAFVSTDAVKRGRSQTFAQWRDQVGRDPQSRFYPFAVDSGNAIGAALINDPFETGGLGWWTDSGITLVDFPQGADCPSSGRCARLEPVGEVIAGKKTGLIRKMTVTFTPGNTYRLSFDARADGAGAGIGAAVLQGGSGFPMSNTGPAELTTSWQHFDRLLTVGQANTPSTSTWLQLGFAAPAGTRLYLDNIKVEQVQPNIGGLTALVTLYNSGVQPVSEACPSVKIPAPCTGYVDLATGLPVSAGDFPLSLDPYRWRILGRGASNWADSDQDGVPDGVDQCPWTQRDMGAAANGCAVTF